MNGVFTHVVLAVAGVIAIKRRLGTVGWFEGVVADVVDTSVEVFTSISRW